MNPSEVKRSSKFLSLVLRHRPEAAGLVLDAQGWVSVADLLRGLHKAGKPLTMAALEQVVAENNKKRFEFSEDKTRIRASQGHTIDVDLGYEPMDPPEYLFHGTASQFLDSIFKTGLDKRERHHVHLSADLDTATNVGSRHGKVVVLRVRAQAMVQAGHAFYRSTNGVWLTESVPVEYLEIT